VKSPARRCRPLGHPATFGEPLPAAAALISRNALRPGLSLRNTNTAPRTATRANGRNRPIAYGAAVMAPCPGVLACHIADVTNQGGRHANWPLPL